MSFWEDQLRRKVRTWQRPLCSFCCCASYTCRWLQSLPSSWAVPEALQTTPGLTGFISNWQAILSQEEWALSLKWLEATFLVNSFISILMAMKRTERTGWFQNKLLEIPFSSDNINLHFLITRNLKSRNHAITVIDVPTICWVWMLAHNLKMSEQKQAQLTWDGRRPNMPRDSFPFLLSRWLIYMAASQIILKTVSWKGVNKQSICNNLYIFQRKYNLPEKKGNLEKTYLQKMSVLKKLVCIFNNFSILL